MGMPTTVIRTDRDDRQAYPDSQRRQQGTTDLRRHALRRGGELPASFRREQQRRADDEHGGADPEENREPDPGPTEGEVGVAVDVAGNRGARSLVEIAAEDERPRPSIPFEESIAVDDG
jgi:hypothetical protein